MLKLGASVAKAAHPRSDLLTEMCGDESACCGLIFLAGISRGREVVGHCGRNEANCSASSFLQERLSAEDARAGFHNAVTGA